MRGRSHRSNRMDPWSWLMHRSLNSRRIDLVLGSLLFSIFLAANLGTSSRSPVIWQDEVMFTDPAANLYFGQGFTTSAWFQSRDTLFAGNSPLYSLCLYPWIRVFGFGMRSVTSSFSGPSPSLSTVTSNR